MRFTATPLSGAYVVEQAPNLDERGSFARVYSKEEFEDHGWRASSCRRA
jgi:dTDP-4-dehydrorhamnose 3,5-epimerase-like enzyme